MSLLKRLKEKKLTPAPSYEKQTVTLDLTDACLYDDEYNTCLQLDALARILKRIGIEAESGWHLSEFEEEEGIFELKFVRECGGRSNGKAAQV